MKWTVWSLKRRSVAWKNITKSRKEMINKTKRKKMETEICDLLLVNQIEVFYVNNTIKLKSKHTILSIQNDGCHYYHS